MKSETTRKKPGTSKSSAQSSDRRAKPSSRAKPSARRSSGGFGDKPPGRKKDFSRSDAEKISHKITCADCGKPDTVPFKPTSNKPVLCRDCFGGSDSRDSKSRSPRGRDSGGRDFGGRDTRGRDFGGRDAGSRGPRSFDSKPRPPRRDFDRPDNSSKKFDELNKKLDKILALLEAE